MLRMSDPPEIPDSELEVFRQGLARAYELADAQEIAEGQQVLRDGWRRARKTGVDEPWNAALVTRWRMAVENYSSRHTPEPHTPKSHTPKSRGGLDDFDFARVRQVRDLEERMRKWSERSAWLCVVASLVFAIPVGMFTNPLVALGAWWGCTWIWSFTFHPMLEQKIQSLKEERDQLAADHYQLTGSLPPLKG
jgi:hypothetical protein